MLLFKIDLFPKLKIGGEFLEKTSQDHSVQGVGEEQRQVLTTALSTRLSEV